MIRNYLDVCLDVPWGVETHDRADVEQARKILDRDHYGLEKVKERILEFIAVRQLNPQAKGKILCLVGPPGVGKTSIALSVAKAMHRKLSRLSLGGVRDEADIRDTGKPTSAPCPGRIIGRRHPQRVHESPAGAGRDRQAGQRYAGRPGLGPAGGAG